MRSPCFTETEVNGCQLGVLFNLVNLVEKALCDLYKVQVCIQW